MEPEGKHRNSIIKQRILAVFGLVEIVLRCTLTMNDFQGLMMQLEGSDNGAGSLEAPSSDPESQSWSKSISGPFQQVQIWLGYIVPNSTVSHKQSTMAPSAPAHESGGAGSRRAGQSLYYDVSRDPPRPENSESSPASGGRPLAAVRVLRIRRAYPGQTRSSASSFL
ncbi:hypothetical protein EVAR_92136_1 [Eumeta japonica]|uniref:Uncharacterized protein n=1 Tax=Eumeta variegata TaxID=151549 RepID=A0A4C1T1C3_EUMVA|nr:hypothetical protein EVAR_92136_1 [Eumeta japonica]